MSSRTAAATGALLAGVLACAGSSPSGQPEPVPDGSEVRTVFQHDFTIPSSERVRVDLAAGTYRMELSHAGPTIGVVPLRSGVQPPTISGMDSGWELVIHATETYEVTATGGRAGQSTILRIRTVASGGGGG